MQEDGVSEPRDLHSSFLKAQLELPAGAKGPRSLGASTQCQREMWQPLGPPLHVAHSLQEESLAPEKLPRPWSSSERMALGFTDGQT